MAKLSLEEYIRVHHRPRMRKAGSVGPYVTISRQYGCWGFSLGMLLLELLNEDLPPAADPWKLYCKDILHRLATETNMAAEILDRERRARPHLLRDLVRTLSRERIPSGFEIRNRITTIIRGLAIEGRAILIGQGGAGATADLPHGISVRLEAPEDWRVSQIMFRDGLDDVQARMRIREMEKEREYLRKIYEIRFPRKPAFHLVFDCSVFTLPHIAQQVVFAMRQMKLASAER